MQAETTDKVKEHVCYVYWIRLPKHTDVFSQGYVGFTSRTPEIRWKQHSFDHNKPSRASSTKLYNSMKKYGVENFIVETLCIGNKEYCLWLEKKLRPAEQIGLNIVTGGEAWRAGTTVSQEEIEKRRTSLLKCNEGKRMWRFHFANQRDWANVDLLYDAFAAGVGRKRASFAVSRGKTKDRFPTIWNFFKNGFIPKEDPEWVVFQKANEALVDKETYGLAKCAGTCEDNYRLASHVRKVAQQHTFNPKRTGRASLQVLMFLPSLYDFTEGGNTLLTSQEIADKFPFLTSRVVVNWLRKFRGWNPTEDPQYLKWREEQLALQERN